MRLPKTALSLDFRALKAGYNRYSFGIGRYIGIGQYIGFADTKNPLSVSVSADMTKSLSADLISLEMQYFLNFKVK